MSLLKADSSLYSSNNRIIRNEGHIKSLSNESAVK